MPETSSLLVGEVVAPIATFPPKYPAPATENVVNGEVVPNPTLELVESKVSIGMAVVEVAIE